MDAAKAAVDDHGLFDSIEGREREIAPHQRRRAFVVIFSDGTVEQSNFHDYQVMRMRDLPALHIDVLATDNQPTGAGQMATPLVAPAISNAVAQLTGRRLRHTPMTPDRVKAALA